MALLVRGRGGELDHAHVARVHLGHQALDRSALARMRPSPRTRRTPAAPAVRSPISPPSVRRSCVSRSQPRSSAARLLLAGQRHGQVQLVEAAHGADPLSRGSRPSSGRPRGPGRLSLSTLIATGKRAPRRGRSGSRPPRAIASGQVTEDADHEADDHQGHVRPGGWAGSRQRHRRIIIGPMTEHRRQSGRGQEALGRGRVPGRRTRGAGLLPRSAARQAGAGRGAGGGGKTELAKAISRATGRQLIRLQCYEGLDEAKALYEWNYRKQLLRIQAESEHLTSEATSWDAVAELGDIFSEEFLLDRPLLQAIAATDPVVLLIDEIDKTDQEFEAMLLEVLSDFQISIPELGVIEARTHPVRRADLEQLARAHRGVEATLPVSVARLPAGRARDGDRPPALAGARRAAGAPLGGGGPHGAPARPEEAARRSPSPSTGRGRCSCWAPTTSTPPCSSGR